MSIQINDRITLKNNIHGVVRYIGPVKGRYEEWVGIELDEPKGSNNGTVEGIRYFYCPEKHGLFVKYEKLTRKMKSVDGLSHSIITSDTNGIFNEESIEERNVKDERNDKLIEENKAYKELLEKTIQKYNEALATIKEHLKKLQHKIESIKIKKRPATEKDKIRRIVSEMVDADERKDRKRFNELYDVFKITMEKYQIKVD